MKEGHDAGVQRPPRIPLRHAELARALSRPPACLRVRPLQHHRHPARATRSACAPSRAATTQFFDAPVGLIFSIDRDLEIGSWVDYGMFLQSIMVAARSFGLETCPQAALCSRHEILQKRLGIPPEQMVVCGMALGYADRDAIVNTFVTERMALEEFVTFVEECRATRSSRSVEALGFHQPRESRSTPRSRAGCTLQPQSRRKGDGTGRTGCSCKHPPSLWQAFPPCGDGGNICTFPSVCYISPPPESTSSYGLKPVDPGVFRAFQPSLSWQNFLSAP